MVEVFRGENQQSMYLGFLRLGAREPAPLLGIDRKCASKVSKSGGVVLAYLLTVAWNAGQTKGVYTPSPALTRLGNLGIGLLVLWIVQFFAIGFYVWAR